MIVACDVLKTGNVGVAGSTGAVLNRSLTGLRDLIARTIEEVRSSQPVKSKKSDGLWPSLADPAVPIPSTPRSEIIRDVGTWNARLKSARERQRTCGLRRTKHCCCRYVGWRIGHTRPTRRRIAHRPARLDLHRPTHGASEFWRTAAAPAGPPQGVSAEAGSRWGRV